MKTGASARSAGKSYGSPVSLRDSANDGEPQTGAVLFGGYKRLENGSGFFRGNTLSGICYLQVNLRLYLEKSQGYGASLGHGIHGVVQKVKEYLPKLQGITLYLEKVFGKVGMYLYPALLEDRFHGLKQIQSQLI